MSARNRTRLVDAISPFHSTRLMISADRRCRLRAPGSSACKARGLYTHIEPSGCEVGDETNGFRSGLKVGDGNGDGNGVGSGNGDVSVDGEGDGAGTTTGVEGNQGTQDWNENGRRGTGSGRVEERRVCASKPRRVVDVMWITGETWAEEIKTKTRKHSFSSCRLGQYRELRGSRESGA